MLAAALVLATLAGQPAAAEGPASSWGIVRGKDYLAAATVNDSGNILSLHCSAQSGSCIWILGIDTGCREGDSHPVLINADTGSTPMEVHCFGRGGPNGDAKFLYAFGSFDGIDQIVREGARMGIAFPIQDERFVVERFNLVGSVQVLEQLRREVEARGRGPTGTRSEIM